VAEGRPVAVEDPILPVPSKIKRNRPAGRERQPGSDRADSALLAEENIKAAVERALACAPELSQAQKDRLVVLLGGAR